MLYRVLPAGSIMKSGLEAEAASQRSLLEPELWTRITPVQISRGRGADPKDSCPKPGVSQHRQNTPKPRLRRGRTICCRYSGEANTTEGEDLFNPKHRLAPE